MKMIRYKNILIMAVIVSVILLIIVWNSFSILRCPTTPMNFHRTARTKLAGQVLLHTMFEGPQLYFWDTHMPGLLTFKTVKHSFHQTIQFVDLEARSVSAETKNILCSINLEDTRSFIRNDHDTNIIYFVTPTYPRPEQIPELTRLSHTLMLVPQIHWIVADDQHACSDEVFSVLKETKIRRRSGLPFTHIASPNPKTAQASNHARGVANRLAALAWLHQNVREGVLYFGDDDNTVDLQLFHEIRNTKKVSMFPVGLIGNFGVSSPIVKDGKVVGFFDSWPASRTFPVDMAGFAVNIQFLKPSAGMPYIVGHEEDRFLRSIGLEVDDIEPLANNCSRILVWHTQTSKHKKSTVRIDLKKLESIPKFQTFTDLLKETSKLGMVTLSPTDGIKPYITRNRKTYKTIAALN